MAMNLYDTLVEATNDLRERGYISNFKLEEGKLRNLRTNRTYGSDALQIVEFHRFEGMSNPADDAIVFAVEAKQEDDKGTIVMNYSSDGNMDLYAFMDKVKIKPTAY